MKENEYIEEIIKIRMKSCNVDRALMSKKTKIIKERLEKFENGLCVLTKKEFCKVCANLDMDPGKWCIVFKAQKERIELNIKRNTLNHSREQLFKRYKFGNGDYAKIKAFLFDPLYINTINIKDDIHTRAIQYKGNYIFAVVSVDTNKVITFLPEEEIDLENGTYKVYDCEQIIQYYKHELKKTQILIRELKKSITQYKDNWISVEDRMPESNRERIIVYSPIYEGIDSAMEKRIIESQFLKICREATHWQPLPPPPEKE